MKRKTRPLKRLSDAILTRTYTCLFGCYRLNYLYGGLTNTRGYHVVNVLLHWVCCILLGQLAGRLLCPTSPMERIVRGSRPSSPGGIDSTVQQSYPYFCRATVLPLAVVLIFGVQPVHTEAVSIKCIGTFYRIHMYN